MVDYLSAEFSTSSNRCFPLIEFIDTPGLTDGTLRYPFDVNEAASRPNPHPCRERGVEVGREGEKERERKREGGRGRERERERQSNMRAGDGV